MSLGTMIRLLSRDPEVTVSNPKTSFSAFGDKTTYIYPLQIPPDGRIIHRTALLTIFLKRAIPTSIFLSPKRRSLSYYVYWGWARTMGKEISHLPQQRLMLVCSWHNWRHSLQAIWLTALNDILPTKNLYSHLTITNEFVKYKLKQE